MYPKNRWIGHRKKVGNDTPPVSNALQMSTSFLVLLRWPSPNYHTNVTTSRTSKTNQNSPTGRITGKISLFGLQQCIDIMISLPRTRCFEPLLSGYAYFTYYLLVKKYGSRVLKRVNYAYQYLKMYFEY